MEIIILKKSPIILTKDKDFLSRFRKERATAGEIILLPEDAILVSMDEIIELPINPPHENQ